ncbi:MAG TPA: glycerophosphodiester phosphodiesterase [Candidatus Limnocylindria bacterium]|nr:glycerophosphodiester phosphodiesterase [Candidatus Limnocylindria bacterium]
MTTLRLAHRGDWRAAPENTLPAMQAALRIPACDGLEFDLRCSVDGVPVLLHDASLARVQHSPLACSTLSVSELAEHGIPTFADVLAAVGCDPFLDIELKARAAAIIDILELERGRMDEAGSPALHAAVLSSFSIGILRWLANVRPTWPRWFNAYDLTSATIQKAVALGCQAISCEWHAIDEAGVTRAGAAGLKVAAFTVKGLADYDRLAALGLVGICAEADALDG